MLDGNGEMSPVLANLFLHYALDNWLATRYTGIPFCRYSDDGVLHCRTQAQAIHMHRVVADRSRSCGLEMHPEKTRIVYCKDSKRRGTHDHVKFDFLGYTFRPRRIMGNDGRVRTGFTPAVSRQSITGIKTIYSGTAA